MGEKYRKDNDVLNKKLVEINTSIEEKTKEILVYENKAKKAETDLNLVVDTHEKSETDLSSKLQENGKRIADLLKSESTLKQQLQSKDRVLLQMNTELYELRKKLSGGQSSTKSADDVIKTLTANEDEIKRLQMEIMQLK